MELIYSIILALIIMVIMQQVQIGQLKSRIKNTTDNMSEVISMIIQSLGNQMKINQQISRNICTLSGINPDDILEKENDHVDR